MNISTSLKTPAQRGSAKTRIGSAICFTAACLLSSANGAQLPSTPSSMDSTSNFLDIELGSLSAEPVKAWVAVGTNEYAIYDTETEQLIAYMAMYNELTLRDGMGGGMGSSLGTNMASGGGYGAAGLDSQTVQSTTGSSTANGAKTASGGGASGSSKSSGTSSTEDSSEATATNPVAVTADEEPETLASEQITTSPATEPNDDSGATQQPLQQRDAEPVVATNNPDNNLFLLPDGDVIASNDSEPSEFVANTKTNDSFESASAVPLAHSFWLLLTVLPMLRRKALNETY